MVVIQWLAKPRLNYIDVAFLGATYGMWNSGHWLLAAFVLLVGIVVSVLAERTRSEVK